MTGWLTYLLIVILVVGIMFAWFWILDVAFEGVTDRLRRRHEMRQAERWKRIKELERELDDDAGDREDH